MSGLKIPHDAWVFVGDGEKAMILRNEGDELYPNLVVQRVFEQDNPPTRLQGTDRPGRYNDVGPGHKSALETTDWHRFEKEQFAKEMADRLYRQAHAGRFDRLVVVAPPAILGRLRQEFHGEVAKRVIAEIDKDLTRHPVGEIEKLITRRSE